MSIQLSGSLILSGSLTATGGITMSGSIDSASYATSASYAFASTSASYALNATSASISSNSVLLAGRDSGVFATTGSNTFVGNQTITGSIFGTGSLTINGCITATGQIVAQTINVQQVTSSVVYSCGDNIFGTALTNTQTLCGNVFNTGSLACFAGRICSNTLSVSSTTNLGGALTGTTACFGNTGTGDNVLLISNNDQSNTRLRITNTGSGGRTYSIVGGLNGANNSSLSIYDETASSTRLEINSAGIATFACQVCAPASIIKGSINEQLVLDFIIGAGSYTHQSFRLCGTNQYRLIGDTNGNFILRNDVISSDVLTFACAGGATFACSVSANKITINSTSTSFTPLFLNSEGNYASSGNMTTGFAISNTTAGRALNMGVYEACAYAWIQAAYINNADVTFALLLQPRGGNVGIGTTSPQAGLQLEKYGSKFDGDNQYNQPAGNVFLSVTNVIPNQDNWFGIRGSYNSNSGSSNLLLQANYRDVNSQAGHYISSKATNFGVADFEIGKLTTSTSVSTPPTKVPQFYITSGGNVGIGITNPSHLLDVRSACVSGATGATIRVGSQNHGGSGDEFANLEFYWGDPDSAEVKAKIYAKNVGNVGPGGGGAADLLFATTPAFGSSTERMRITSAGIACFACTVCAPIIYACTSTALNSSLTNTTLTLEQRFGDVTSGGDFQGGSLLLMNNNGTATWAGGAITATVGTTACAGGFPGGLAFWVKSADGSSGTSGISQAMRIDWAGRVGIGTTNPSDKLTITDASTYTFNLGAAGGGAGAVLYTFGAAALIVATCGSSNERMRITSGGNVGIGTTSPNEKLDVCGGAIQVKGESAGFNNTQCVTQLDFYAGAARLLSFGGNSTTCGGFRFYSAGQNNAGGSDVLVISGGGAACFRGTVCAFNFNSTTSSGMALGGIAERRRIQWDTTNNEAIILGDNDGYFPIGASAFNVRSDYRLKEDLKQFNGLDKISQIKVYDFKWKDNEERSYGVLAHELKCILNYVVSGEKDALREDGSISPQGVDYSKLTPILVKAIQEQQCTINTLKTCLGII